MSTLFIDFETRSTVDIRKAGADVYARHPSTEVMCLGLAPDEQPVELWAPWKSPMNWSDLKMYTVVAHNAPFEVAIWNHVCVKKYGWPPLDPKQVVCTMAMAYAMNLPGALEDAAPAAGLTAQKDTAGHRIMLQLSKPRDTIVCVECFGDGCTDCFSTGEKPVWWARESDPEKFEKLYAYCMQDIEVERALFKRLMRLSPSEQALWQLDHKINQRGVQIDVSAAKKAIELVEAEQARLNLEMREVTSGAVATCTAVGQFTHWLKMKGMEVDGVAKADIVALLDRDNLPTDVRRALELRQEAAKSSTKKLSSMVTGACDDGRVRGLFQYHGAGATGRFAGRRIQPQNFPRPKLKQYEIESVFEILREVK